MFYNWKTIQSFYVPIEWQREWSKIHAASISSAVKPLYLYEMAFNFFKFALSLGGLLCQETIGSPQIESANGGGNFVFSLWVSQGF